MSNRQWEVGLERDGITFVLERPNCELDGREGKQPGHTDQLGDYGSRLGERQQGLAEAAVVEMKRGSGDSTAHKD